MVKKKSWVSRSFLISVCLAFLICHEEIFAQSDQVEKFINQMEQKHNFDRSELSKLLGAVKSNQKVLSAMSRPSTSKPWFEFKKLFVTKNRIEKGLKFWRDNNKLLDRAEVSFGVPAEIIVAIIGVETIYGSRVGSFGVLESLYTLGFEGQRRRGFFLRELEEFLLLCRENSLDTRSVKGSFAGAMGVPQFMPSSYRAYAVDFDEDGKIDLWNSLSDAVGSVANYLRVHGWRTNTGVAVQVNLKNKKAYELTKLGVKPHTPVFDLVESGVILKSAIDKSQMAALFSLQNRKKRDYWLSFNNFYVITRYNRSLNYGIAVHRLAEILKESI